MVLIQTLTVDAINTALIALQRGQSIIIGGDKGQTVNNINVTNKTEGADYSEKIKELTRQIETLKETDTALKAEDIRLNDRLNALTQLGISDFTFDDSTRELTIELTDGNEYTTIIRPVPFILSLSGNTLVLENEYQREEVELPFILSSEKGAANGVATLDATGRVPYSQLPESAMEFKGEWNADTNTPHLQDGTGTNGDFYICSQGGTVNFGTSGSPRNITFYVNDRVIYQGDAGQWKRLPASEVRTVNGQSGDVVLNGTNVNYSNANNSPTLKDKIDSVETKAETQSNWTQSDTTAIDYIKNKPNLATVATSGSYNDLSNKPTIPAAQIQSDWEQTDSTKKDFIKNKIPIWITSGSADDNMSPIDSVTDGSMRPITSNAVADIMSNLPTDAILHYSFDNVPDYPDGNADIRLLNNNTYDLQSTDYRLRNNGGSTFSNNNGNVQVAITGGNNANGCYFSSSYVYQKILKLRIRVTSIEGRLRLMKISEVILQVTEVGVYEVTYYVGTSNAVFFYCLTTSDNATFTVEQIYIGDGSYTTPIIDNANGQNNATNNGGIATKGVSGKGVRFLGNGYISGYLPWTPYNQKVFTVSCWVKNWDTSSSLQVINNWSTYAVSTMRLRLFPTNQNKVLLDSCNTDGYVHRYNNTTFDFSSLLSQPMHIVVIFGNTPKLFINGVEVVLGSYQTPVMVSDEIKSRQFFQIGRTRGDGTYNYSKADIDDFQIFDRALSETEVQALYLNKANTPKYYSWADWKLSQIS